MFNRIIVGYDGTEGAEDALALGRRLAAAEHGRVIAACTYWYEPRRARIGKAAIGPEPMRAQAAETLAPLRERYGAEIELAPVAATSPARALYELADNLDADLIVVGSTTRGAVGRAFAGSTAELLLHGGPCAVAVAPRGYRDEPTTGFDRIGAAYCADPDSGVALEVAHEIAAAADARLDVISVFHRAAYERFRERPSDLDVYVVDTRSCFAADLDDAIQALGSGVPMRPLLIDGEPQAVLQRHAAELDLLVMGSRAYGPLRRVLMGSTSHGVLQHAPCPVLVVPRAAAGRFRPQVQSASVSRGAA